MKKVKHTSGPWIACLNVPTALIPGHIIKADNEVKTPIALLEEGGGTKGKPRQIANAHLIAAAPELLDALKKACEVISAVLAENINDPETELGEVKSAFLRLIKKAEGKPLRNPLPKPQQGRAA